MENGKDSAYMSKSLATIKRDVPLEISLDDITHVGINRPEAKKLFLRYNLLSAMKRWGLDKDEEVTEEILKRLNRTTF
jgi:DNA polymerase-1